MSAAKKKKAVAHADRIMSSSTKIGVLSSNGSVRLGKRDTAAMSVAPNRNRGRAAPRDGKRHQSALG